jgi:NADH dehydrogenase/NADH:ubiquinone oxidoreductase subunit G
VFPVRTHAEKDGTFVNGGGLLQRFRRAVDPENPEVTGSASLLSALAGRLGMKGFDFQDVPSVFLAMAREEGALSGWTHSNIPDSGIVLKLETRCPAPFKNIRVDPNAVPPGGPA